MSRRPHLRLFPSVLCLVLVAAFCFAVDTKRAAAEETLASRLLNALLKPAKSAQDVGDESAGELELVEDAVTDTPTEKPVLSPTHRHIALIKVNGDQLRELKLQSFCLNQDGNLLAGVGDGTQGEIRVFNPAGELQGSWEVAVTPEAVNVGPQGTVFVAGDGELLEYDADGQLLHQQNAPHAAAAKENSAALRKQIVSRYESQAKALEVQAKRIKKIVETLENKEDDERTGADERSLEKYRQIVERLERRAGAIASNEPSDEQIEEQVLAMSRRKIKASSISSTRDEVFLACAATEGYGFDVWRMDADFGNAKKILKGLRGCCGQMDVRACKDGLYVAENSRHRVCHYDREGKLVTKWGSRARTGVEGFGGCCNPMNVAFGTDGDVYTAESTTGRIKRYSKNGELIELVGKVDLVPGCKNVCIAVSQDRSRVYMLDITRNHIVVMAKSDVEQVATAGA